MQMLVQKRAAAAAASVGNTDPQPVHEAAPGAGAIPSTARLEELAEQILQELQRRKDPHEPDFSLSKLLAGIVQIVALAALVLAYFIYRQNSVPVLLTALFLEAFTIALLIMGRQR